MFENKKLILFDLDGTLIDSVPDLVVAVNHTLTSLNKDTFSLDTIKTWMGNGALVLIKRALSSNRDIDENLNEDEIQKALDIFLTFYKNNLTVKTTMYKGVDKTLKALRNKNYIMVLVTNKPFDFIDEILDYFKIKVYFDYFIGADSLDEKKPSAKPLLHVCEKYNVSIDSALMIGDSKNDILAAKNAHMDCIAVSYGYNHGEDISDYDPNFIIDDFSSLDKLLKGF